MLSRGVWRCLDELTRLYKFQNELRSTREVWNVITGKTSLNDPAAVGAELERCKTLFQNGLDYYKRPSSASVSKVKSSTEVKRKEFLLNLGKFLDLDEWQTHELFQHYLRLDFRGSGPQLQAILKHEAQLEGFQIKVLQFYFKERYYLLKCLKYILSYWQDDTCLYHNEFSKVMDTFVGENIIQTLIKQLENKFKQSPNHDIIKGNPAAQIEFTTQFIKEQKELVEIILLYYKDFEMPVDVFMNLAKMFRRQHFGYSQVARKYMNQQAEQLAERISFITSLILLEGLDLELLRNSLSEEAGSELSEHHMLVKDIWKEVDKILYSWDDVQQQGPVLLGWTVFRQMCLPEQEQQLTSFFGDSAMKCHVTHYLNIILTYPAFIKNDSPLTSLIKTLVYILMSLVLKIFHEDTVGEPELTISIICKVISEPTLSRIFLTQDQNGGVNLFLKSTKKMFPYMICPYLDLMTCLCSDTDVALTVYDMVERHIFLTEAFSSNKVSDVQMIDSNESKWERTKQRVILKHLDDFLVLPSGVQGKVYTHRRESRLVSWKYSYSGWLYLFLQLNKIVEQPMSYVSDSGEDGYEIAISIIKLVTTYLKYDIKKTEEFEPIISTIFRLMQRMSDIGSPPVSLLACCLQCIQVLTKELPVEMWNQLMLTKFLPCHQTSVVIAEIKAESKLNIGLYGILLQQFEIINASFKLTIEYLQFLLDFMKSIPFTTSTSSETAAIYDDVIVNLMFVLKEIFSSFSKWRYTDPSQKGEIGLRCLEIFHLILTSAVLEVKAISGRKQPPPLKELVTEGLLYHQAGETLVNIISIGVDSIELLHEEQSSSNIIQLVKFCLAILNTLFNEELKDTRDNSPLQSALSQQYVQQPSDLDFVQTTCKRTLLSVIAKYIFHRTDPKLPILAVLVLRSLAKTNPMVLTASFGDSLVGLRNAFVHRLLSLVEPVRLKIAIIEFLVTCVESQPGIVESFTQLVQDKNKQYALGKFSCLNPILEVLENKEQVDVLTSASVEFLATLWKNRYDIAMTVIKKRPGFWSTVCYPLVELKKQDKSKLTIDVANHILTILSVEVYYVKDDQCDKEVVAVLKKLSMGATYSTIFQLLHPSVQGTQRTLIISWQTYLSIMKTLQRSSSGLDNEAIVTNILKRNLDLLEQWLDSAKATTTQSRKNMIIEISNLCFLVCNKWKRFINSSEMLIPCINRVLFELYQSDMDLFEHVSLPLYLSVLLQLDGLGNEIPTSLYSSLLRLFAMICTRSQYKNHQGHSHSSEEVHESQSSVVGINLLNEIMNILPKSFHREVLDILQEYGTVYNILDKVNICLQKSINDSYVEAVMLLFLTGAKHNIIAEHLSVCGIGKFLCLSMDISKDIAVQQSDFWIRIWTISLSVTSNMLKTLKHYYLQNVIDFIGSYKELLYKGMNVIEQLANGSNLSLTEHISALLYILSSYQSDAAFALPDVFTNLKLGVTHMVQITTALLARSKLLSHLLECKAGDNIEQLLHRTKSPSPTSFRSDSAKSGHTDVSERLTPNAEQVHSRLTSILSNCVATMRNLTPNIVESILDEGMDIDSFSPLIELNFSSATLESDSPASFGTLISTLNICIKMIQKLSQGDSDRTTPEKEFMYVGSADSDRKKTQLWFIIDNVLCLLISQASCYLRHPGVDERGKQFLKRELASELTNFLYAVHRLRTRRGIPPSPISSDKSGSLLTTPVYRRSPSKSVSFSEDEENSLLKLTHTYTKTLLR